MARPGLEIVPLTPERWAQVDELFGPRGACAGCWCQYWKLPRSEFEARKGAANRRAFRGQVRRGPVPGLLALRAGRPIGWCAVAPRGDYPALERSHVLAPVDARAVWSVSCLFVSRGDRGCGVSVALLRAAVDHVRACGGRIVEGYPVEPRGRTADAFVWTGLASAFRRAGFREVARRSPTRPIMRRAVRPKRS